MVARGLRLPRGCHASGGPRQGPRLPTGQLGQLFTWRVSVFTIQALKGNVYFSVAAELKMDVMRERELKESLERRLVDESRTRSKSSET